jgi:hypothetical protein
MKTPPPPACRLAATLLAPLHDKTCEFVAPPATGTDFFGVFGRSVAVWVARLFTPHIGEPAACQLDFGPGAEVVQPTPSHALYPLGPVAEPCLTILTLTIESEFV